MNLKEGTDDNCGGCSFPVIVFTSITPLVHAKAQKKRVKRKRPERRRVNKMLLRRALMRVFSLLRIDEVIFSVMDFTTVFLCQRDVSRNHNATLNFRTQSRKMNILCRLNASTTFSISILLFVFVLLLLLLLLLLFLLRLLLLLSSENISSA